MPLRRLGAAAQAPGRGRGGAKEGRRDVGVMPPWLHRDAAPAPRWHLGKGVLI